jgi:hypothetical protein
MKIREKLEKAKPFLFSLMVLVMMVLVAGAGMKWD